MVTPGPSSDIAATTSRKNARLRRSGPAYMAIPANPFGVARPSGNNSGRYQPRSASGVGPAIAEAHKVIDFDESFIALEELFAHALDNSSNVCPITVFAAAADEAFVVYPIVDRPVGHPAARIRRQEMGDIVLDQGQAHVDIVPICPADIRVKDELAADHETGQGGNSLRFRRPEQTPQTPGQNFNATGLVDEVDSPRFEREVFLGRETITGKKHHRQVYTALAQHDEQFDARYAWKVPVEKDDVSITGEGEPIGE